MMSYCPRCYIAEESHEQLMQCTHAPSTNLLTKNIAKLHDWLQFMNAPGDLETQIISYINSYFRLLPTPRFSTHHLIQKQLMLGGWQLFMQGRIHLEFHTHMQQVYADLGETKKNGNIWVAGIIQQQIWTLLYSPIWDL